MSEALSFIAFLRLGAGFGFLGFRRSGQTPCFSAEMKVARGCMVVLREGADVIRCGG